MQTSGKEVKRWGVWNQVDTHRLGLRQQGARHVQYSSSWRGESLDSNAKLQGSRLVCYRLFQNRRNRSREAREMGGTAYRCSKTLVADLCVLKLCDVIVSGLWDAIAKREKASQLVGSCATNRKNTASGRGNKSEATRSHGRRDYQCLSKIGGTTMQKARKRVKGWGVGTANRNHCLWLRQQE